MSVEDSIRPHLLTIKPYEPVLPKATLGGHSTLGNNMLIKLNGNENPYGPSPKVVEALRGFVEYHIYPDPNQVAIRTKLSSYTQAGIDSIIAGSGCDELIDLLLRLTVDPHDEVIDCTPTFGMYSFSTNICGGKIISVPRDSQFDVDVDAVIAAVTARTKLIFVASPNNTTGNILPEEDLLRLIDTGILIVIDETYYEFSETTYAKFVKAYPNLIILRSLSKWAGLASLRIGYGLMDPRIVKWLMTIKPPYNINAAAELALLASLDDIDYLKTNVKTIIEERDRMIINLENIDGLKPLPSTGNFILVEAPLISGKSICEELSSENIFVRDLTDPRLQNYIRLSIGTRQQNDRLIWALTKIIADRSK